MELLNRENYHLFIDRLQSLENQTVPLWGKMNASEMVKHCRLALELPLERLDLKTNWFFKFIFGRWIKNAVTNDKPFSKNSPTTKEFHVHDKSLVLADEMEELNKALKEFAEKSDENLERVIHPIFGKLTAEEWRKSHWKHLDHHWRQFGL